MDYKRVLILHFTNGMSGREIAETTGDKKTTVNEFLKRFRECEELSYPLSEDVTNEFIAGCLYKKAGNPVNSDLYRDFDFSIVIFCFTGSSIVPAITFAIFVPQNWQNSLSSGRTELHFGYFICLAPFQFESRNYCRTRSHRQA